MTRRLPVFTAALLALFVVTACSPGGSDGSTTQAGPSSVATTGAASSSTSTEGSTSSTDPTLDTTLPAGTEGLPLQMRQEIAELIQVTQEVRGLEFLSPPTVTVVTGEELEARVRETLTEEAADVPADEALLKLLGLVDRDVDLLELYLDLYGEQVAGFYDGETAELVIPAGETLSPLQKATLVHELTHAITDQRFGFHDAYQALIDQERFDQATAMLAVVEGDATLTEILYIQRLSLAEQQELLRESLTADSAVFQGAPMFLQNSLLFPYQQGLSFVQRLFDLGGFDEVNRAYVEPPVSSEQIISPRDYQRDQPIPVQLDAPDVVGYEVAVRSVWGELGFDLMFDQVLGGAGDAADGWGGDAYVQWFDGIEAAMLLEYIGDTPGDAGELSQALIRYIESAMTTGVPVESGAGTEFAGDDYAFVARVDDRVVFVVAGDPEVGRALVAGVSGF